jgi:hypothetical protein
MPTQLRVSYPDLPSNRATLVPWEAMALRFLPVKPFFPPSRCRGPQLGDWKTAYQDRLTKDNSIRYWEDIKLTQHVNDHYTQ